MSKKTLSPVRFRVLGLGGAKARTHGVEAGNRIEEDDRLYKG